MFRFTKEYPQSCRTQRKARLNSRDRFSRPWPGRPAALLFGGAALMVGSACGFEMLANPFVYNSPMYKLEVLFEETGEMMGMTTILLGSYDHLKQRFARPVEID